MKNFKRIKSTIRIISILSGALFFFPLPVHSRSFFPIADSLQPDTITTAASIEKRHHKRHDSIRTDTLIYASATIDTTDIPPVADSIFYTGRPKKLPSPQRATILSAVIPGLGQAYNGKYWKIPIIYTAGAGLYYYFYFENKVYLKYLKLYREADGTVEENIIDAYYNRKEDALTKRDYAVIYMGILYLANIVDAMADAYFLRYDISEDLSVDIKPIVIPSFYRPENYYSCGLSLNFNF